MSFRAPAFPPFAPTGPTAPDPTIIRAVQQAAGATNIDFNYLMAQAQIESGLHAHAAARGSSARGLYQFIDSTWLDMFSRFGAKYGVGSLARQITVNSDGHPVVADGRVRRQILALRNDPTLSAALAAEYARSNKQELEQALGRPATSTDLYLAHFLGPAGATDLLRSMSRNSNVAAARLLPAAAAANPSVFYNRRTGAARSVAQIYKNFAARIEKHSDAFTQLMEGGSGAAPVATSLAAAQPPMMALPAASRGMMPLPNPAGRMMPLRMRQAAMPLVAMLNDMAVTAMKTLGHRRRTAPQTRIRAIAVAPEPAAAPPRRRANQLA